jgi:hypothetical protein
MVDDNDFREGFIQGFRSICGSAAATPATPARPATKPGRTPFQMGVLKGVTKGLERKGETLP